MADPVVIIGAGLSGLTCSKLLHGAGVEVVVLDAADGIGGRVRTDHVDGFQLDRGFQVLLTAYPEARLQLDYGALDLKTFASGSLIRTDDGFQRLSDPWRHPSQLFQTALARVGSIADKMRVAKLRAAATQGSINDRSSRGHQTTDSELRSFGFSDDMIRRFLRPFLSGVFLEPELETSAQMMYFVFRMFSTGDAALPAAGMAAIPQQLAATIPEHSIRLNSPISSISVDSAMGNQVKLATGETLSAAQVVLATDQTAAAKLLPSLPAVRKPRSVRCVYFAAPDAPVTQRMLVLNGAGTEPPDGGPVNNLCVPSQIAESYASNGKALVSASVLDTNISTDELPAAVKRQLQNWFGNSVEDWKHLRTYEIPAALPNLAEPRFTAAQSSLLVDGIYVCGDHRTNGSINGAMQSGRETAEAILGRL